MTMLGKLSVSLEDVGTMGKVFVIKISNNDGFFFNVSNTDGEIDQGFLTLRISKDTALLLSQYIEEELDTVKEVSSATH